MNNYYERQHVAPPDQDALHVMNIIGPGEAE